MSQLIEKSELLFLYESTFSQPNGDPFTGEQRYDDETKKILVSDVRIKRFIRDYLLERGHEIFVVGDKSTIETAGESGAASRLNSLMKKYEADPSVKSASVAPIQTELSLDEEDATKSKKAKAKKDSGFDAVKLLQKCVDVRLFGGISTKEGMAVNLTGPVQFALLSPSLNAVDMRMHQNTSVFSSSSEKSRGAIGTTTLVPFAVCQIHGWINPYSAKLSGMTVDDETNMLKGLWQSINNANTRSKSGQNSLLLLQIIYTNADEKLYGVDRFVKLESEKRDEQLRSIEDFKFDFSKLKEAALSPKVKAIRFYTEIKAIEAGLIGDKFQKIEL